MNRANCRITMIISEGGCSEIIGIQSKIKKTSVSTTVHSNSHYWKILYYKYTPKELLQYPVIKLSLLLFLSFNLAKIRSMRAMCNLICTYFARIVIIIL